MTQPSPYSEPAPVQHLSRRDCFVLAAMQALIAKAPSLLGQRENLAAEAVALADATLGAADARPVPDCGCSLLRDPCPVGLAPPTPDRDALADRLRAVLYGGLPPEPLSDETRELWWRVADEAIAALRPGADAPDEEPAPRDSDLAPLCVCGHSSLAHAGHCLGPLDGPCPVGCLAFRHSEAGAALDRLALADLAHAAVWEHVRAQRNGLPMPRRIPLTHCPEATQGEYLAIVDAIVGALRGVPAAEAAPTMGVDREALARIAERAFSSPNNGFRADWLRVIDAILAALPAPTDDGCRADVSADADRAMARFHAKRAEVCASELAGCRAALERLCEAVRHVARDHPYILGYVSMAEAVKQAEAVLVQGAK